MIAETTARLETMRPRLTMVRRVVRETHDTFTLFLKPCDEEASAVFLPGQFNMLYVFGVGEVPISVSGDAADTTTWVHTIRAVGMVTDAMRKLKAGERLGLRGPYGTAWPLDAALGRDLLLVAGGIGLAPVRPILYDVLRHRKSFGKVTLLYGTRTPSDVLYARELERWRGRFDLDIQVTVDRGDTEWMGPVGVVTQLLSRLTLDPHNTVTMLCGPEVMMRFTIRELQKKHVGVDNVYLSMERNMKCAVGFCGHCQLGPTFICKDGPVYRADRIVSMMSTREL